MRKRMIYKLRNLAIKLVLVIYTILVLLVVLTELVRALYDNDKHLTRHAVDAASMDLMQDINQRRQAQKVNLDNLKYQADTLQNSNRKASYKQLVNQARQVHDAADQLLNFIEALESRQSQSPQFQQNFVFPLRRRDYFRAKPETVPALSGRVQAYLKRFVELTGNYIGEKEAAKRYLYLKKLATMPAADFHEQFYNKRFIYTQNVGVRVLQSQVVEMESNFLHNTEKAIRRAEAF